MSYTHLIHQNQYLITALDHGELSFVKFWNFRAGKDRNRDLKKCTYFLLSSLIIIDNKQLPSCYNMYRF